MFKEPGKAIWLCGGAEFSTQLLAAGLIDQFIIKLNPVVFGSGIPLFANREKSKALTLIDSKAFKSGHLIIRYEVVKLLSTGSLGK